MIHNLCLFTLLYTVLLHMFNEMENLGSMLKFFNLGIVLEVLEHV